MEPARRMQKHGRDRQPKLQTPPQDMVFIIWPETSGNSHLRFLGFVHSRKQSLLNMPTRRDSGLAIPAYNQLPPPPRNTELGTRADLWGKSAHYFPGKSGRSAQASPRPRPDCWTRAQRKGGLGMPDSSHLNDRSGELRCTAKNLSLHLRENAASAKVENPRSVLSAQRTSIQTAANYRFPPKTTALRPVPRFASYFDTA